MADLANVFAVLIEFQKLRGAGGVGRPGRVPARENEDVSLGIHGHAGNFAEIHAGRKLQRVGHGIKWNFRSPLLGDERQRRTQEKCKNERKLFHLNLPDFLVVGSAFTLNA